MWKINQYAVYGEVPDVTTIRVHNVRAADITVGVYMILIGAGVTMCCVRRLIEFYVYFILMMLCACMLM